VVISVYQGHLLLKEDSLMAIDDFIMRTLNLAPDQIPFSQQRQDLHEMNRLISIMLNSIWQRINTDSRVAERDLER